MPDDDCIQFMGMKSAAARVTLPMPRPILNSRPVTGLELHIEKSATEAAHTMTFHKLDSPVVHIGRRPGSDSDKRRSDPGKAFFNCPVVSRHHAKLAFSDSGHLYLIDLDSHHGSHIRKRDEAVSKQIPAETPTLLAEGDVVTFGKSVGSDKGLVRPVVARVDLLYGSQPPLKPLVVPAASISRSPSGRYGVYVPEASPSSDDGSPDSHDSDIEEISGPSQASSGRPPWHSSSASGSMPTQGAQKPLTESFPARFSPFGFSEEYRAFSPVFSPGPLEDAPFNTGSAFYNVGFDAYSNDIFEEDDNDDDNSDDSSYSRSTSPMDLSSSPEPAEPPVGGVNAAAVAEPTVIGAWPRSRSPSVFSSSFPSVRIFSSPSIAAPPVAEPVVEKPVAVEIPPVIETPVVEVVEKDADEEVNTEGDKEETDKPVESTETAQLKASLATVKAEVAKLHAHRRKYKQRFNDNLHVMNDKFSDLEEKTTEVDDLYHVLSDRLEENVDACHQAQAQLDALQVRMDDVAEKAAVEMPPVHEASTSLEEAKASAQVLEDIIADMSILRDNARKEMAKELQAIRETKEALKSLTAEVQVQVRCSLPRSTIVLTHPDRVAEAEAFG
ncbi:hypothetical protein C8R46DRAFT_1084028 [Mycena filopes]|nr:hypothetical protein C8R46DRAFT_1084028 [Mycena filopes]